MQQKHAMYHEHTNLRQWSLDERPSPPPDRPVIKRMSLPTDTFDLQPHKILALKQSLQVKLFIPEYKYEIKFLIKRDLPVR